MLFLDTLKVNAANVLVGTQTISHSFYMTGDLAANNVSVGTFHYVEPLDFKIVVPNDFNVDLGGYYYVAFNPVSFSVSGNNISVSNFILRDSRGYVLSNSGSSSSRIYKLPIQSGGSIFELVGSSYYYTLPLTLEYDLSIIGYSSSTIVTTNHSFSLYCRPASSEEVVQSQTPVSDISANNKLNDIKDSQEAVENSVTNPDPDGKGLFETISDFFGGFFTNIINSLISVFVPEDGFFSTWFDNLNTLLSDKLGMLYAPFDLLVSTLQSIYSADSSETGIPFPGIQWDDTWLISPFTFTFDSLGDGFTEFRDKVYFATDTVLIFAFLILLQKKVRLILEGHEQ